MTNPLIKFAHKILFLILYLSFFIVVTYPLLAQKNLVTYNLQLHQLTTTIFITLGLFLISIELVFRIYKAKNKKKLFTDGLLVVMIIFGIYFIYLNHPSTKRTEIKKFFQGIFYDSFGYPSDPTMATGDELFASVNQYRYQNSLPPIEKRQSICDLAQEELSSAYSLIYTKNYLLVKENMIIQVFGQPTQAENIINRYWWRPFGQQKKVISQPDWRNGCAVVSNQQLVFIFSQ